MKYLQKYLLELVLLLVPFFLFSCSSTPKQNVVFEEKFGKGYEKIKADRTPSKESQEFVTVLQAPTEEMLRSMTDHTSQNYYAYVDVSKFGEKTPQQVMPNGEFYEQSRAKNPSNSVPSDLFEVTYSTALYPAFRKTGAEFDNIAVPPSDVYGVKTEMSEKPYLLAGNDSLQRNIIQINSEKDYEDVEISEILIKEQKQLKRKQKMREVFGDSSFEMASVEQEDDETFIKKINKQKMVKMHGSKNTIHDPVKKVEAKQGGSIMESIKKIFKK